MNKLDIQCPKCGAHRDDECSTLTGRNHQARVRVIIGQPTPADERALERRRQEQSA